jgi:neopullulanase
MVYGSTLLHAAPQQVAAAPEVTKVEPPNWWIGLTPEVLLLVSGHDLEATHVSCNLPTLRVTRTQATARGHYLFIWLKIGPETRSGTAVCRIKTAGGPASFELPLGARTATTGKFQGLTRGEVPYFIVAKPLAEAEPANDKSSGAPRLRDESMIGAPFVGDLREIREHLTGLKSLSVTALRLGPITLEDPEPENHAHNVADFYSINPHLGSLKDFQDLVASAHAQNRKVILDLELLYLSARHPWVAKPPLGEWLGAVPNHLGNVPKPSGDSPNAKPILETENPLVALYLLQNGIWWVETAGLDGIHVTKDPNVTSQFWGGWRAGLQKIYPHLTTVRE